VAHAGFSKGDIILFKKDGSLYLHRVLSICRNGLLMKGDMSFGCDGAISPGDILARAISVERGRSIVNLNSRANRFIAVLAADLSLFLQYIFLPAQKAFVCATAVFSRFQGFTAYRRIARYIAFKVLRTRIVIRRAEGDDIEQMCELYRMRGSDIVEGLCRVEHTGFWFVAECNQRLAGGLTITPYEKDPSLWMIFGLEVKLSARGLGIGRSLVSAALSQAKKLGAQRIGLFVKKNACPALGLYYSLGFKNPAICLGISTWQTMRYTWFLRPMIHAIGAPFLILVYQKGFSIHFMLTFCVHEQRTRVSLQG